MSNDEALRRSTIRVADLSAGFGERTVLRGVELELPDRGVLALLGPAGGGKSTLLRTLVPFNERHPSFWSHGRVVCSLPSGRASLLSAKERPKPFPVVLLVQKARLYTASIVDNAIAEARPDRQLTLAEKRELAEQVLKRWGLWSRFRRHLDAPAVSLPIGEQRLLSLARIVAAPGVRWVLVDEPFRDISETEARWLEDLIASLAREYGVLMVTHNQQRARRLADRVLLLAGGRVIEGGEAGAFFASPATELGRDFVRLGSCWPKPEAAAPPAPRSWRPSPAEARVRPGGFHWIDRGRLGGMQRPGLMQDERVDLEALRDLGCDVLVSLTEEAFPIEKLKAFDIAGEHLAIVDMSVPTLQEARALCCRVVRWMRGGRSVVLHCKAGLGRTGTLLACVLVATGTDAVHAIDEVRAVNPRYIQSEQQLRFVELFARSHLGCGLYAGEALVGDVVHEEGA